MRSEQYQRPYDRESRRPIKKKKAEEALVAIWKEYERRLMNSSHVEPFTRTKNEAAKYFLRREIYALGLTLIDNEKRRWCTSQLVESLREKVNRPDKTSRVFHDLLMSIYSDDSQIGRRERWMYAQELEYARRHGVPPEYLCGFLLQSGRQSEIPKKLKAGYIEPAFRSYDNKEAEEDEDDGGQ